MKTKYEVKKRLRFVIYLKKLRELEKAGYTEKLIARYYGKSRMQIWRIRKKMNWKRKYAKNNKI